MARLTVEDITSKQFIGNDYGYDRYDVDGFLDEICDEIETLTGERETAYAQRDELQNQCDELQNQCDNLQKQVDELKQKQVKAEPAPVAPVAPVVPITPNASEDAEMAQVVDMLSMTKRLQKEVLAKAEEEANAIRTRATAEAEETLQGLEKEKTRLTDEVTALKKVAIEYRGKFEQLLQAQQDALDKASDIF